MARRGWLVDKTIEIRRSLVLLSAVSLSMAACENQSGQNGSGTQTAVAAQAALPSSGHGHDQGHNQSQFVGFRAPAGDRPTAVDTTLDGRPGAILPNGRFVTPAGTEVNVLAPKPFGLAVSPDENTLATINSGTKDFSVTLIRGARGASPTATMVPINATFMGVVFSPDGKLFYASGGDNGNIWVGDVAAAQVIGSVNLNGASHPLDRPLSPTANPAMRFKGTFPGNMVLSRNGRYLYVVDQGAFQVHAIDTTKIVTGVDGSGNVVESDNFAAVISRTKVGHYPFGIALTPDQRTLLVSNVGVFQYTHLRPATPTGDKNTDYPLCVPGMGYPDEVKSPKTINIHKIDATTVSGLPTTFSVPDGIRCGYIPADVTYTIPAAGDPNAPESSSVFAIDVAHPDAPSVLGVVRTGLAVGAPDEGGRTAYGASHPNAIAVGGGRIYVSSGTNDTIAVLDQKSRSQLAEISLSALTGSDHVLRGVQPVALALAPDNRTLYVAEAGLNAIAVVGLDHKPGVDGLIPTGWWPSSVQVSHDGQTLFVATAKGRGNGPNLNNQSPKLTDLGIAQIIPLPGHQQLADDTAQVLHNNGFDADAAADCADGPIPNRPGVASHQIKHVIFINKENSTHDQLLGDITSTRQGVAVDGDPAFSLGLVASPNHHELALRYSFGDNFFLEPTVSSDGHRWLTNNFTTELEETHWPASYGGHKNDSGDDPDVIANYPGRIGFTDANASPEPNDMDEHGGIYKHLVDNGLEFVNFGNGFEFALVDEDNATEPTGIREHANVPREEIVRVRTDDMYPEFNTHIPDAPLPENPDRYNRFGRFKQMFEAHFVDRGHGTCKLPPYTDLYYPNDHGGGANDINPNGPAWDYTRFVQDNDAAVGLTVELLSKSPCWKDTVIFVVEDDTQNGSDHVDGYRSIFLAISPWVKRENVIKTHVSLASIFKTVDLIFGIGPLNQYDAAATDLRDAFTSEPDFSPYDFVTPVYVAKAKKSWKRLTRDIDFSAPDRDEEQLRRAIARSEGLPHHAVKAKTKAKAKAKPPVMAQR
jgi:DNA-binding beta-propeller fold protein YncE